MASEQETILGIPISLIKSRRNLIGVWRAFGVSNKEAFDALRISDEKMAEYLAERRGEKAVSEDESDAEESDAEQGKFEYVQRLYDRRQDKAEEIERYERAVEERLALYLEDFDAPLQSDKFSLRTLASMDVWLENIQRLKLQYVDDVSSIARKARFALIEEEKKLSAETRLLQKSLGIDRPTRDRKRKSEAGADAVTEIVKGAKEFIDEQILEVHHCGILLAWLWLGFAELGVDFVTICPRCKQEVRLEIEASSTEDTLRL